MGKIYSEADHVIVWLGETDRNSDEALDFVVSGASV